jgi:DNA-binding transcriptional LysR family regulator
MDLDLRKLRYFVAVAMGLLMHTRSHGSFTAAS